MLERYIPAHREVISVRASASDVRAAAFKTRDGEYTIVAECNSGLAKSLTVDFSGVDTGKIFGKHIFSDKRVREGNALIPERCGSFSAGSSFTDSSISSDYCVVVYTSLPAQTQVEVNPVNTEVQIGASCQMSASVVDGGDVVWSIAGGAGMISSSGLYTAPLHAVPGDMVAVRATSTADPAAYGIALITLSHMGRGEVISFSGTDKEIGLKSF